MTSLSASAAISAADTNTFEVRRYEIVGNTLLDQDAFRPLFTNAIGPAVTLDQVFKALAGVHRLYLERGFGGVVVSIPQQELTAGLVTIQVNESAAFALATNRTAVAAATATNTPAAFEVRDYDITGNTLRPGETIKSIFAEAVGKKVTVEQIRKAVGDLQLAYRERGFVTVSVNLPPQQLTNAVVKVNVTEGTLAVIKVTGNRYFSSNNVMRALPGLQTNVLLNGLVFQRQLDAANENRDRRIYPTLSPGPDPGTSALDLNIKDRLPLHGRFDVDNYATPGTPDLRMNFAAQYNNLWQLEHQAGLYYGFSPEEFKSGRGVSDYFFNRPLVAYYGAYYRLPLGQTDSLQDEVNNSANFGYDEATRQFHLPPVGERPILTFYANAASGDTGVQFGPRITITNTPLLSLSSQDSGQDILENNVAGVRLGLPLMLAENSRLGFSAGVDFKTYALTSFNTNNFPTSTTITNSGGSETNISTVSSPQPNFHQAVEYLPLIAALDFSESDRTGKSALRFSGEFNFIGNSTHFSQVAYSTKARATFEKFRLTISREQMLPDEWSVLVRAAGQASPNTLINSEQFALGGVNSVRGYFEGETYGDSGWFTGIETRTPLVRGTVASWGGPVPAWIRASIFTEYGQRFLSDAGTGLSATQSLWGAGFGLSANINNHLEMRLAVSWPLLDSDLTRAAGSPLANFTLGGQF